MAHMTRQKASDGPYILSKINHLVRTGLASPTAGIGQNGGAAPDWLVEQQKEHRKRAQKARARVRALESSF